MTQSDFAIYVFSHNRGDTLDLALASCLRNFPQARTHIVDDHSDCPQTVSVIQKWQDHVEQLDIPEQFTGGDSSNQTRGGLHTNMQVAIEHADSLDYRYALFLQDDMQFVRPFEERDQDDVRSYFFANLDAQSLHVTFDPFHSEPGPGEWEWDPSRRALLPGKRAQRKSVFSCVDLFQVKRFLALSGNFAATEQENVRLASENFLVRGVLYSPLSMFLPYPRTCANRRARSTTRRIACRIAEKLAGSGVHPFLDMDAPTVEAMRSRARVSPARAREWLTCPTLQELQYWSYYGGLRDLRARGRLGGFAATLLGAREPKW